MDDKARTRLSKFLSFVLRHEPESLELVLDANGWVEVDTLLAKARAQGREISRSMLEEVVATNSKKRFSFSEDGLRIRANQGHSVDVDLGYEARTPPDILYHGTARSLIPAIREQGLRKMQRHHVHLSLDSETALSVGRRHGAPVVLRILAGKMHADGCLFYLSANGVWLTEQVASKYIEFPEDRSGN